MIYFAKANLSGLIKIGHSGHIESRLKDISRQVGEGVELIRFIEGERKKERAIHRILGEFRSHGEWFFPTPEVLEFIETAETFELENIEGLQRVTIAIPDDVADLVIECAELQNRTVAGQLRHLIVTHPELIGMKAFKNHAGLQAMLAKGGKE